MSKNFSSKSDEDQAYEILTRFWSGNFGYLEHPGLCHRLLARAAKAGRVSNRFPEQLDVMYEHWSNIKPKKLGRALWIKSNPIHMNPLLVMATHNF